VAHLDASATDAKSRRPDLLGASASGVARRPRSGERLHAPIGQQLEFAQLGRSWGEQAQHGALGERARGSGCDAVVRAPIHQLD
jgi:hypothetical protein